MYSEIPVILTIENRKARIELLVVFIKEYAQRHYHLLNEIGKTWGAGGERNKAFVEAKKTKEHIELLERTLFEEIGLAAIKNI